MTMNKLQITPDWTLFLDRDGVINKKIENGYVLSPDDLEFLPDVFHFLAMAAKLFQKIIIVTNQQCIGKGLLTVAALNEINSYILNLVELNGGRIDAVYFAPDLAGEYNTLRKPATGMAELAKADFPEINFEKSLMIGDSLSDMQFGKALGMTTIFLNAEKVKSDLIDFKAGSWKEILELF